MWIYQKVYKDPEVKKTLQEITKLINSYSDATKIRKKKKFFIIDIGRAFKPKLSTYLITLFAIAIIEALLFLLNVLTLPIMDQWARLSLNISLPILVLGISLSTVAKSLSESSRFASEYLKESCQTTIFACITFLTVFYGYLSGVLFTAIESSIALTIIYILLSPVCVGGALWCLTSLIYIILETTKCMYPEYSSETASNYASRKLRYAFLKDVYISVFMRKYQDIIEEEVKKFKNIYPPSRYFSREILQNEKDRNDKSSVYEINLPKEIKFHLGYRDYNLRKMEKINKLLEQKNAKMYMTPHNINAKEFGILCCKEPCDYLYNKITRRLSSIYRFRRDKYIEEEESFWVEHYIKLRSALLRAIEMTDMAQFKKYLKSIEETYVVLRKARRYSLVRESFNLGYKKVRYLFVYSKSVKWLLSRTSVEEDILESFLDALVESIWNQVKDEIKNGDCSALDIFIWLLPETYQLFIEFVKDKKSRLWELRGRIGSFYDFAGSLISEHESNIKEDDKLQIQIVLHKGIIKWLLIAIDNKDNELIKSLCKAAKKLVFQDKKVIFEPQRLVAQHFILCGKVLEFLMSETPKVSPNIFKLLCFDEYDHITESDINFEGLVAFFIESRKLPLRDFLREFSSTDWEHNPLSGGGFGTPRYTFSGNIELDYMFIYIALSSMHFLREVQPIAFEFWGYNLKDKIDKFREIARGIDIYDYSGSKEKLIRWLDGCDQLYKQEKEERIATAPLDEQIVSQYKDAFWDGYKSVKTFSNFCISRGYYSVSNEVSVKHRYIQSKDIFIKEESHQGNPHADGADISRYYDKKFLKEIIKPDGETQTEAVDNITSLLNQAYQWLTKEGTNRENGILLFYVSSHIQSELYNNDNYIHSWKEDTNLVFSGYYKNYPMIEIYDPKIEPKCVALNLQGWKGLEVRPEVLEKDILGTINIREWTNEEIDEAIRKKEITEEDRNRVKGRCPVEYELFWRLNEKILPIQMVISLKIKDSDDNARS